MLENELKTGREAVLHAMRISRTVQKELAREDCITKKDKSPVTRNGKKICPDGQLSEVSYRRHRE
jgi:3'-phosphoadenosine 5'-phosphosulfate (PAPS) 3'-phosphatase